MKGCARARGWLLAEVDGDLSLEQRLQLDQHLARCPACRAERDALSAIEQALASLPEPPVESLDLERAVSAVRARIEQPIAAGEAEEFAEAPVRSAAPRALRLAAAAAGLLAAGAVLYVLAPDAREPAEGGAPAGAAVAVDTAGAPDAASAAEATPAAAPAAGDALDQARLDAARAAVGERLAAAFAGVSPEAGRDAVMEAALRFEADTSELARGDWPLLRIAQRLASHPDDALACAALRYLGVRGDAIAAAALRDALARPALGPAAVAALGDLGAEGLPGLAQALERPELCAPAVERIAAVGGPSAALVLAQELERRARLRRGEALAAEDEVLLNALAALHPCPAMELLELAQRGLVPRDAALDALAEAQGASDALAALARGGAPVDTELLLAALARLRPPAALPFVEEQATLRRTRDAAHDCLAAYADAEALEVLLRLRTSGRGRAELVLDASARLLASNPEAAVDLARRAFHRSDAGASSELLDLLLEVGTRSTAPGLAALAFAPQLSPEERPWAALALGELGDAAGAEALVRGLAGLAPGEQRLAAACLLAASALGSRDQALSALAGPEGLEPRLARRLDELCDEASREGMRVVTLHRVARELGPLLEDRSRAEAAGTP